MRCATFLAVIALFASVPAAAQIGLPDLNLPRTGEILAPVPGEIGNLDRTIARTARDLLRSRERDLERLVRRNTETIEFDSRGNPARRGELLVLDLQGAERDRLILEGFAVLAAERVAGLGFTVTRLAVPAGSTLPQAEALLVQLAPEAIVAPDNLHFQSGSQQGAAQAPLQTQAVAIAAQGTGNAARGAAPVGVIDGAPSSAIGQFPTRGFADGAPVASDHGSAITSLLLGAGISDIKIADVYGSDPAGGNALAIMRALGWLVASDCKVVTISLVGPRNALLEYAVKAAQDEGVVIVAAVGNDGPAAPAAYPASYANVVAVTGVDGRRRALIEAGRALHLDYAAPGADLSARARNGRRIAVRGTSYAAPLVAARLAHALSRGVNWRRTLDSEALDLGKTGPDDIFGRGLLCADCEAN